jgi:hypothetical protein
MTVSDLLKVYDMDMDKFESYSLEKGFSFYKILDNENYKGQVYEKGTGNNTKYLSLFTKYFNEDKHVSYQTSNPNEILNIKNQFKTSGFSLFNEKTIEGRPIREYINHNKYMITIIPSTQFYEIELSKF